MPLSAKELEKLTAVGIVTSLQAQQISSFQENEKISKLSSSPPHFSFEKTLYYLGGFLIVLAIAYFMAMNWEKLGSLGMIICSASIVIILGVCGIVLKKTSYKMAGTLLLLASTASTALLIYSIEKALGWWPNITPCLEPLPCKDFSNQIDIAWILLDSIMLVISTVVFCFFRRPILSLPIAHFFWFLTLDTTHLLIKPHGFALPTLTSWITLIVGIILVSWGIYDHRQKQSTTGVWPWLYGLGMMLGALICLRIETSDHLKILYQFLTLGFGLTALFSATPLKSKTFLVFGALGILWFIQDIAWTYFRDSLGFSALLLLSGVVTIIFGIAVQRFYKKRFSI